jgi:hypothetical protein
MSDDPTRPDLTPDELASAHVDGLTTPDEVARIGADPDLQARVARLQAARDAVRVPDLPPDDDRREAAIAAALGAVPPVPETGAAPVDELAARRGRATRRLGWAAAVAAAVALALVLPRVLDGDSGSDQTTGAAAPKSSADQDSADRSRAADTFSESAGAASGAPTAGSTTTLADQYLTAASTDLGSVEDLEGLVEPARRALESPPSPPVPTSAPLAPDEATCLRDQAAQATAPAEPGDQPPTVILSATATVHGERALVLVIQRADGGRELVAAKAVGCELLGTLAL